MNSKIRRAKKLKEIIKPNDDNQYFIIEQEEGKYFIDRVEIDINDYKNKNVLIFEWYNKDRDYLLHLAEDLTDEEAELLKVEAEAYGKKTMDNLKKK